MRKAVPQHSIPVWNFNLTLNNGNLLLNNGCGAVEEPVYYLGAEEACWRRRNGKWATGRGRKERGDACTCIL